MRCAVLALLGIAFALDVVAAQPIEGRLKLVQETAAVRIAYLEGVLELMSPSRDHELLKT